MTYSTITSCRLCTYGTEDRSNYYCGKGLEENIHGCSGYKDGVQAVARRLPEWDNPYPIHPYKRHRAKGCMVLPIDRENLPYTNVMTVDRYLHPFVDHKASSGLVVEILNIMATYPAVKKALLECKFPSAYGVEYRHCIGRGLAEVSTSISMLWGVYKVQVYVQVLVFSLVDNKTYRSYIQNEKNNYIPVDTKVADPAPWWSQKDTVSVINEVPEQYWWLDPELPPETLIPMHALLSVLIEVLERDYTLDSWTYREEAVPILTGALNMGLRLRGRRWLDWAHTLYPFLSRYFTEKVQAEVRGKWEGIVQKAHDPWKAVWL